MMRATRYLPWFGVVLVVVALTTDVRADRPAVSYDVTDLGEVTPASISDRGHIVGTAVFDPASRAHAFMYEGGLITDLGVLLPGGTWSYAADVNNRGQAVGGSNADGLWKPFHPVLYVDGSVVDLGIPGGPGGAQATGINDAGDVVGAFSLLSDSKTRPILYRQGAMYELDVAEGYDEAIAYKINNAGHIVGWMWNGGDSSWSHSFLMANGVVRDLGTLGGRSSFANDINDNGSVVGFSSTSDGFVPYHAFRYERGVMTDLGTLGSNSQAYAINNRGDVVGYSCLDPDCRISHAFLNRDGRMIDLNDVIPAQSGAVLVYAVDINNAGEIVALGATHGFLLTPTR